MRTSFAIAWVCLFVPVACGDEGEFLKRNINASVMVVAQGGTGSGVGVKNGPHTFVWTDAHVVSDCQQVKTVVDVRNQSLKVSVTYKDIWFVIPIVENGRKVGEDKRLGKILRYSAKQDIAMAVVYQKNWLKNGAKFSVPSFIPKEGEALWHIGSAKGSRGMNSVFDGVFSFAGRLRLDADHNETEGFVYDQVSLPATNGCSGGGVFSKKTGECLGLVTESLYTIQSAPNMVCMTPSRRLWDFAKRNDCEWAMTGAVPVPAFASVITDDDIAVPDDFPGKQVVPKAK